MTGHPAHSLADGAARLAPRRAARSLCLYAVAAVAATAFFFWLHHLGNGIPYELAQQRFAAGPLTGGPDGDVFFDAHFEYCEIASAVMVGARDKTEYGPLVDAILPRNLAKRTEHSNYCPEAKAEARGADVRTRLIQFRYWWGGKAIFAIALQWLSVLEFHRFIEVATYAAWLTLAGAMALHGARALILSLPPVAFALAFSGVSMFPDAANGLSFLWAVATAVLLAGLLAGRRTARAAAPFCFAAGMVSVFLWHFDGHNFLGVALLGFVVWLARANAPPGRRVREAAGCVVRYIAGFAICFALGQTIKAVALDWTYGGGSGVLDGPVTQALFGQGMNLLGRINADGWRGERSLTNNSFVAATPRLTKRQGGLVIAFSAIALAAAAAGAVSQARRRRDFDPAWVCLWFVGLMLALLTMFVIPNDGLARTARYLFLPLALCWSCLAAVVWSLWGLRGSLAAAAGALAVAAWPGGLVSIQQGLWREAVESKLAGATPVASADFDIYLVDDGKKIIYTKDICTPGGRPPFVESVEGGWMPRFFLHLHAKNTSSWERIDFKLYEADFAMRDDSRCVAMLSLPDPVHNLKAIRTGQFDAQGVVWDIDMEFSEHDADNLSDLCGALARGTVYGNNSAPYVIHVSGGARACSFTADGGIWNEIADAASTRDPVSLWLERYAEDGDHLVWVYNWAASRLPDHDAADLRGRAALREVFGSANSAIFRVQKNFSATPTAYHATLRLITSSVPVVRSFFDLYVDAARLIYVRSFCSRQDTEARFALHVVPVALDDLSEHRAEHGFENRDFDFVRLGAKLDGKCIAVVPLPAYAIALVRTGQWNHEGDLWKAEVRLDGRGRRRRRHVRHPSRGGPGSTAELYTWETRFGALLNYPRCRRLRARAIRSIGDVACPTHRLVVWFRTVYWAKA